MQTKVISGGQTGADRTALEVAETLGIPTGGWAPPNFNTSGGSEPELGTRFGLQTIPAGPSGSAADDYAERTRRNVDVADATLAFRLRDSPGTDLTIAHANSTGKPLLVVELVVAPTAEHVSKSAAQVRTFLDEHRPALLNVAGHSASAANGPHYEASVRAILMASLR